MIQGFSVAEQILIVDPDSAAADVLAAVLKKAGYQTKILSDGETALREVDRCDAVVTEHALDGTSGLRLVETLHQRYPMLPVLMMSAVVDSALTIKAVQAGAYDFLGHDESLSRCG